MSLGWVVGLALLTSIGGTMAFRRVINYPDKHREFRLATKAIRTARVSSFADLTGLRKDYNSKGISDLGLPKSPMGKVAAWIDDAFNCPEVYEANAMCLATVGDDGRPSARFVLAKGIDERGITWYTNYNSRKAKELDSFPHAAITFWWGPLQRSVRLEGEVFRVSEKESNEYYSSRPIGSRIGAWVSDQSQPVASRQELDNKAKAVEERFSASGNDIPRPPHWGGFRLQPNRVEFWSGQPSRLHDRIVYTQTNAKSDAVDQASGNKMGKETTVSSPVLERPEQDSDSLNSCFRWEVTRLQP